jgi:hypothetical protein
LPGYWYPLLGFQEESHFGLSEGIDRLFGISYQKQGPAVTRSPSGAEALDESPLAATGVLEFVYEDLLDTIIQEELEVTWRVFTQGPHGSLFQPDEIKKVPVTADPFICGDSMSYQYY